MQITEIHAGWQEKKGFTLERFNDESHYVFIHFLSNVIIENGEKVYSGGCIFYRPHSYRYIKSDESTLLHDWFHVKGDIESLSKKYGLELNKIYYPENSRGITDIVRETEIETLTAKQFSADICDLKIEELIAKIARSSDAKTPRYIDGATHESFIRLRTYMQSDYFKIKSVEPLAKQVNLSVSRFYTLYKEIFGISPKQDLLNIRLDHAKGLLKHGNHSVSEAAEILGYTNQYHFIRQFKSFTGTTPAKYAKNHSVRLQKNDYEKDGQ